MSQISQMIHGTVPENASNWIQVRHGEIGKITLGTTFSMSILRLI